MHHNDRRNGWEAVIGLEIHAELNTRSKLFSSAQNLFGAAPNTNIDAVCVALPGALPKINEAAVRKAAQFGLAIGSTISHWSRFERKSYFYPDSPRNFQITQLDYPLCKGGSVPCVVGGEQRSFRVDRVQLEDDSGMLKHFTSFAGVDFNRAGVPLIEVVSEPDMRSAKEAVAYATAVRSILDYLDACDCNMEEGSLRFDVNISVRKSDEKGFRSKTEIKNMNSFYNLEQAIEHEIDRQIALYEAGESFRQATVRWDPEIKKTIVMRSKEQANDYRYFPEPDLPPLLLDDVYIEEIRKHLPELPLQKEKRYLEELQLPLQPAYLLASDKKLSSYFERALESCKDAKQLANWITVEFFGRLKETGKSIYASGIDAQHIAELVCLILDGTITGKIAKSVADDMVLKPGVSPRIIIDGNPHYKPVADEGLLKQIIAEVLAANQQSVTDFKAGRDKAFAFLVGQVMKKTGGAAQPALVNQLLKQAILER